MVGSSTTSGRFFYNWDLKKYRVDRADGKYDRYCGSAYKLTSTPCSHYVSEGKRYLDYPEKNYCCYCCDAAHGCGVLSPDWVKDGTYKGQMSEAGVAYDVWDKPGLQSNLYWQTTDSKRMFRIDQQPDDVQTFDVNSFSTQVDDSVFDLPSRCSSQNTCSWLSVCTPLRS